MSERLVTPVSNNLEKYYTYREYISKYNRAMRGEFYFEALLIDYAMLEDRLRSMLYYMGALQTRDSIKINCKKTQGLLKKIVHDYSAKDESNNLGITSITGKIRVVRCVALWALAVHEETIDDRYGIVLKKGMEGIDIDWLIRTLSDIQVWCRYRNEIIHCLLNKNIDSVGLSIAEQAETGFSLARDIDTQVRSIKRGNMIRRKMNLPIEKTVKIPKTETR